MLNYIKIFVNFIKNVFTARWLLFQLAKNDFKIKYLGSYLGLIWAFVQPTITVLIFWFVFQAGFRLRPVSDIPFIIWLLGGLIPWFYFAEAWASATNSIMEYSYLVKKVVFKVSLLPIIKILSASVIHFFFMGMVLVCMVFYKVSITLYMLQIIYYLAGMLVLLLGLSWLTSALVVFIKDIGQVITVFVQFGMWATPIFWSLDMMPEKYHFFIKLNPMYYITNGYRNSILAREWFWQQPGELVYFWAVASAIFVAGAIIFYKLRPHFADVL